MPAPFYPGQTKKHEKEAPLNRKEFIPGAASLIVSNVGSGRVIVFADNPNFRGTWYGTNKLFLNAIFLGDNISVPSK